MSASAPEREFRLGEGKISGVLSAGLGVLSVLAVLCFHFPAVLTTPMMRAVYPVPVLRHVLAGAIAISFAMGIVSFVLRPRIGLGLYGMLLAGVATALGGSRVEVPSEVAPSSYAGLDWFVLDLLVLALLFVPLERLWPKDAAQKLFRAGFRTDLAYFFVTHVLVQITVLVTMAPARLLFGWAVNDELRAWVAAQPLVLQFFAAMFVSDFSQYWVHRASHELPVLWRSHRIHHSSQQMDWLMGSRLHLVDIFVTRSLSFIPLFLLGFHVTALNAYLTFVAFHAVLIHANARFELRALRPLLATPYYHHWHHSAEPEAINRNYAVHLPLLDRMFGTAYEPDRWPKAYGLAEGPIPEGWLTQLVLPWRREPRASPAQAPVAPR